MFKGLFSGAGREIGNATPPPLPSDDQIYLDAIVSEIRLLLDYVTGSPAQTLKDLSIPDPNVPQPTGTQDATLIKNTDVLNRLNDLEQRIAESGFISNEDRSFLQVLRDALGMMVRPASGLTIAYTALVVGNQRGGGSKRTRAARAQIAYANLAGPARRHRWAQRVLLAMALLLTLSAVYESARVALGRSILQSLQALNVQRVGLSQEAMRLEQAEQQGKVSPGSVPDPLTGAVPPKLVRLCDRPRIAAYNLHKQGVAVPSIGDGAEVMLFETPAQQDICDRDSILAADFKVAHAGLGQFDADWAAMIRPEFAGPSGMLHRLNCWLDRQTGGRCEPDRVPASNDGGADIDFRIAPVLLVLGNYVLPIIFATLGATVYVILNFYSKLQSSLLAPRDNILAWIRLVLGMVLGACVGLFFSASDPAAIPSGAGLAASITLSASGLAFLAGFGVEGVFGLLDTLVRRVFSGDQDKGGSVTTS